MAGQCLAWFLLVTYIGVMCFSGGATFWAYKGFKLGNETDNNHTVIEPTMPHSSRFSDDEYDRRFNYDDFLVIVPSGTSAFVSMLIVVIGICSRSIFRTTQAVHGSLCLAIFYIVMMVLLLLKTDVPNGMWWIIGINAGAIVMNGLQVFIGAVFLKWQNKIWITLNFKQLFTLNSCFFMARTVLTGFLTAFTLEMRYWCQPSHSYDSDTHPPWSFYVCAVAIGTGIVLNLQCLLSVYFGVLHRFFAVLSSLLLIVAYGCMGVLISPLYLASICGRQWFRPEPLIFSAVLFTLHLVHLVLLFVTPNGMTYSLFEVNQNSLKALKDIPIFKAFTNEQLQSSYCENLKKRKTFRYNSISLIGSIVTLIVLASDLWSLRWPRALLIAVNTSLLSRSLVSVLSEAITLQVDTTTVFQTMLFVVIEGLACFVGFMGACISGDGCPIAAGIGLLLIYIMKFVQHHKIVVDAFKACQSTFNYEQPEEESQNLTHPEARTEAHEEA